MSHNYTDRINASERIDEEIGEFGEFVNKIEKTYENYYILDFVFIGHTNDVIDLCYQSEKNYLYSSSKDNSLKIWDLAVN